MDLLKEVQAKEMFFSDIYFVALMSKCAELKELIKQSLEPDGITCTCLVRVAVQAGRTVLLAKFSDKDPKSARGYDCETAPPDASRTSTVPLRS